MATTPPVPLCRKLIGYRVVVVRRVVVQGLFAIFAWTIVENPWV